MVIRFDELARRLASKTARLIVQRPQQAAQVHQASSFRQALNDAAVRQQQPAPDGKLQRG
ncbi:MAG: hypothetical protein K8R90_00505 [Candidatus Cloacimonetes bacterium]|nr:hypothetical protein [Candidatus Cloacimonadota bacterium]